MIHKLKNLRGSVVSVTALARDVGRNPVIALFEYAYLRRIKRFTEHNIRYYKLLSPEIPYSRKHEFIPSDIEAQRTLWEALNPEEHEDEFADKAKFYRAAEAAGLPVPRSYALIGPEWATDWAGNDLGNRGETLDYLRRQQPPSVVIKPTHGNQARMTYLGTRCTDMDTLSYADPFGTEFSIAPVLDHCLDRDAFAAEWSTARRVPPKQTFILQEYTEQARLWAEWFGTRLAPVRLITLLYGNGDVTIIGGYVFIYGNAFRSKEKIHAPLDTESGEIGVGVRVKRPEWVPVDRIDPEHDVFKGKTCLHWDEFRQVAQQAARAFPHNRAVAWDFVATEKGPVILEGNTRWNVFSLQAAYNRGAWRGSLREAAEEASAQKKARITLSKNNSTY